MRKCFVLVGLILVAAGSALAQDDSFPKVETSPAFMFIRTPTSFTVPNGGPSFSESLNCAGGGGTFAYNFTSVLGLAADLGGCKYFGETVPALASKISGNDFTYMFGPRFTFRSSSAFRPFFEVNFGGNRLSLSCDSGTSCSGTSYSKNAFALTAGGGFDISIRAFRVRTKSEATNDAQMTASECASDARSSSRARTALASPSTRESQSSYSLFVFRPFTSYS
jgi:hypothetical protein